MQLRYYQTECVAALWDYFAKHDGNPVVSLPTGTGKSLILADFIRSAMLQYPQTKVIALTHVRELVSQNHSKLLEAWPTAPAGIYSAGLGRRELAPIIFGGIASVAKRAAEIGWRDLAFVDECHLVSHKENTMYRQLIAALLKINPKMKTIGLSATCFRLGLGHLTEGGLFTHVAYDNTKLDDFNRLISEGYLAPLVPKRTGAELDITGVSIQGGEFNQKELEAAVDKEAVTYYALRELVDYGRAENRRSWLIFATGIHHTDHVAAMLREQFGVSAYAIHSKTPQDERDNYIRAFKAGQIQCLVNSNILIAGFDHPAIDLIGVLRPTNSPVLWVQCLGRGTRPAPNKLNCLVLDFARNTKRLGPINDPVMPKKRGKGGARGEAPVKVCPVCDTYNHTSVRFCTKCGAEFERSIGYDQSAGSLELIRKSSDVPQVEIFKVDRVTYSRHKKRDRPDALKVSYFCNLNLFNEYVLLEHEHYALHRAHEWWRLRSPVEPPGTIDLALHHTSNLIVPTHLRVWVNKQHPEILDYAFEGIFQNGNESAAESV